MAQERTASRRPALEPDDLLRAAARLYYIDNLPEREVAAVIGGSHSRVSRLLRRARERGVVRITVEEYNPRRPDLEERLTRRYGLEHAVVLRTPSGRATDQVRRAIGYFAAPHVARWVRPRDVVGVAGGRTLAELIRFLTPGTELPGVSVVQLMGNIGASVAPTDAVELSRLLAERLRGTLFTVNAPAFVPDRASRDVFLRHQHVRAVWRLFDRMRVALVGIGTLADSLFIERGVLTARDLAGLAARGAVGEICGRFFDSDGRECVTAYRSRVVSVALDVLRRRPLVVGVTNGRDRATAVRAALEGRILKALVIDEEGAAEVLDGPRPHTRIAAALDGSRPKARTVEAASAGGQPRRRTGTA
jgi:DNA-binding transcriptional regulator LsrR (DeoR family)